MINLTRDTERSDGGFATLELDDRLVSALATLGYEEPTPIQREAIPPLLAGRDLLGQAATGTGKTAAFALPLLQLIAPVIGAEREGKPAARALVLVPTRELAIQVAEAVHRYGRALGVCVVPVYGGQDIQQQLRSLRRRVDVVVATPGRALDHVRRGSMKLDQVRVVVLDEADEMLDMGFADDLEAILEAVPEERQTALFSATMPPRIAALAERHLRNPVRINIRREQAVAGEMPRVRQVAYVVERHHKVAALGRVLDMESPTSAIVFCRTRIEVDGLTESLAARGYDAEAIHGGMTQEQRDRVMRRFREGTTELLIATDVAARGLDIEHLSHVINFDVPSAPDAYVHRIGRTGRAGREGVAITLTEPRERPFLRNIEQFTKQKIQVEAVPTVLDLRVRRLELTRASIRETLLGGDLDPYRVVLEMLSEEFDVVDVVAAAVKLVHEMAGADGDGDETEIPPVALPTPRAPRSRTDGARGRKEAADARPARRGAARGAATGDMTKLYIGLGRRAGIRPGDLVGAIANETGIDAHSIGAIDITEKFSLVEVPVLAADDVISALRGTTIRGKKVIARRDRDAP
ncbi:MAG: DEAD/DEAH box helicase [Gemmatimonadota bacterium]|nr:DEAD/DEAH box helicase [Gemmatimonadota bacterium]